MAHITQKPGNRQLTKPAPSSEPDPVGASTVASHSKTSPDSTLGAQTRISHAPDLTMNGTATQQPPRASIVTAAFRVPGPLPAAVREMPNQCAQPQAPATAWQPLPFDPTDQDAPVSDPAAPRAAAPTELQVATTLLRLCAEVAWGLRPTHQCISWASRRAYDTLSKRHLRAKAIGAGNPPITTLTVTGVHAQISNHRVMECSAVMLMRGSQKNRAAAIAVRAAYRDGRWWVTAVEM